MKHLGPSSTLFGACGVFVTSSVPSFFASKYSARFSKSFGGRGMVKFVSGVDERDWTLHCSLGLVDLMSNWCALLLQALR